MIHSQAFLRLAQGQIMQPLLQWATLLSINRFCIISSPPFSFFFGRFFRVWLRALAPMQSRIIHYL